MNTGVFVFVGTSRSEESKQGKEVLQQFMTDICKQKNGSSMVCDRNTQKNIKTETRI